MTPKPGTASAGRLVRDPATLWRYAGDSLVVLAPAEPEPMVVRGSAALLWELLSQACSEEELVASVAEAYGVDPDQVAAPVGPVVAQLVARGAVQRIP